MRNTLKQRVSKLVAQQYKGDVDKQKEIVEQVEHIFDWHEKLYVDQQVKQNNKTKSVVVKTKPP